MFRALLRFAFERLRAKRCKLVIVDFRSKGATIGNVTHRCSRWDGHHGSCEWERA